MMYQRPFNSASLLLLSILSLGLTCLPAAAAPKPDQVIDARGLKIGERKEGDPGDRPRLDFHFNSAPNPTEVSLQINHRDAMLPLFVLVNEQPVGQIGRSYKIPNVSHVPVPAGVLKAGENTVSIVGEVFGRNALIEQISLFNQPLRELLKLRPVSVTVTDEATGQPVPARISIVNRKGEGPEILYVSATNCAVRIGMIYTTGTRTSFEVPEGEYEIYATRGMEWGLGRQKVSLHAGPPAEVALRIRRQVDTTGFVAADTHIHNVTFSGHGDATIDERMVTLAGEGVELAVATDHNHLTDYRPYQARLKLNSHFTPVVGNEMTTKNGHLNAFPMPLGVEVPNARETNWVKLVAEARMKGAKVVILNHPRWPDETTNPMMRFNFNRASGDRFNGPAFTFNAMELVNSSSGSYLNRKELSDDELRLFADWFPILNRGEKITGVGASDSHTANNPVGQGRTYIRSSTDDAAHLDVDELVRTFLAGDTSVSYGIFAEATVNQNHHMGELVRPADGKVDVDFRVASADWIQPRRAVVFLNGLLVAKKKLQPTPGKPFDQHLKFSIKTPPHDAYLVGAVFGDGVTEPYWPTVAKFTAAVANPIYLDNDGDGRFQSPRETARKMLTATDGSLKSIWSLLEKSDDALAGQMLGLLYLERDADFVKQLDARLRTAAAHRELYQTFLAHSPLVVVEAKALKASTKTKSKNRP